jgi:hypothetical protein
MPEENEPAVSWKNVLIGSLRLPADGGKLRTLLARTLNASRRGQPAFHLVQDAVTLRALVDAGEHSAAGGGDYEVKPYAVLVGLSVRRAGADGDMLYCPYVFAEDVSLLTDLRERYGYPVWAAEIRLTRVAGRLRLTVRTPVFSANSPESSPQTLLCVEWANLGGVHTRDDQRSSRSVQLAQIRDAADPDTARFQEAVTVVMDEVDVAVLNTQNLTGSVTIAGFRTLDLLFDLGLKQEYKLPADGTVEVSQAASLTLSLPSAPRRRRRPPGPLPKFVEWRVDPRSPPPYAFDDVRVKGFKFTADRGRLDLLVDALLNANEKRGQARQNFAYRTATAEVVIELLFYGGMRSTAPETEWRRADDFTTQNELVVRLLVGKTEADSVTATDPGVFCPFLFVDNWVSMVSGREVVGLWKRMARFTVKEAPGPHGAYTCDVLPASQGAAVVTIEHPRQWTLARDYRTLDVLPGSQARGVLPWVQEDFGDAREFRREFARDWLKVSGEQFGTVQRTHLPRPGERPYCQWVEATYGIRSFAVSQPTGRATLTFGSFRDKQLARLLVEDTRLAREIPKAEWGVDGESGVIEVARLLGLGDEKTVSVTAGNWYEATGSFDLRVVDPLGDA